MKNKIQLITYPDSLGKNLKELEKIVDRNFKDIIGGIHLLPFYPSSGDRGFAPLTHLEVDPSFGDWDDIKRLSEKYILVADIMVNHISAESVYFKDYLEKGEKSKYSDFFITNDKFSRRILPRRKKTPVLLGLIEKITNKLRDFDRIFHSFGVNKFSLKKVYRPRPETPFVPFDFKDKSVDYLWCTFTKDQIDLDVYNENVRKLLRKYITNLAQNGVDIIRLDAVGYAVKKRGTKSFMLPETKDFINWLGEICHDNNLLALPEIHNHYSYQTMLSSMKNVDYVYDFQIPMLILNAIYKKSAVNIKKWLKIRPNESITALDTHDGIPIIDVEELLTEEEISETSERIISNGGNEAKRASGSNGAENVDTYQINCTYYSALGENPDSYIVARAIQFFIPGIPQIYYMGLLAGKNDVEKLKETNIGRDINRHNYTIDEVENEMEKDVVKRLMKLMKFRNTYPVFDGDFSVGETGDKNLSLRWEKDNLYLEANIDLRKKEINVVYLDEKTKNQKATKF